MPETLLCAECVHGESILGGCSLKGLTQIEHIGKKFTERYNLNRTYWEDVN